MIANILQGESVSGIIKYITEKKKSEILGFKNMYSEKNTDLVFFEKTLKFLANRKDIKNKYTHISLNLSHNDNITDEVFYELSKDYMKEFGYGNQPFLVVKHNDTKHPHVHIVTTKVKEDLSVVSEFNNFERSMAITRSLEKKYNLKINTSKKVEDKLKYFREGNIIETIDSDKGVSNYIKEVINILTKKYKFKNYKELQTQLKNYNIKTILSESKKGVLFGINKEGSFKTPLVPGSKINSKFSLPKLNLLFEKNNSNKLLYSSKKRISKQLNSIFNMYKEISIEDFPDVAKNLFNINVEISKNKDNRVLGYTIMDKTGYIFKASELDKNLTVNSLQSVLFKTAQTHVNIDSREFKSIANGIVKDAFKERYFKYIKQPLLYSELIEKTSVNDLYEDVILNPKFKGFKDHIRVNDSDKLNEILIKVFNENKNKIGGEHTKKELLTLKNKIEIYKKISEDQDLFKKDFTRYHLIQSLGLKTNKKSLSYNISNKYSEPIEEIRDPLPDKLFNNSSIGFSNQNYKILDYLILNNNESLNYITASAFFLPLIYRGLYENLNEKNQKNFQLTVMGKFLEQTINYQRKNEKNEKDFINLLNHKGFYIVKEDNNFFVHSQLFNKDVKLELTEDHKKYLESNDDLNSILKEQEHKINRLLSTSVDPLKSLWLDNLIEKGIYDKAAFLLVNEKVNYLMPDDLFKEHLENGLRKEIEDVRKINITKDAELRKKRVLYAIKSLLNNKEKNTPEAYNGFKDELTDFSKYISLNI